MDNTVYIITTWALRMFGSGFASQIANQRRPVLPVNLSILEVAACVQEDRSIEMESLSVSVSELPSQAEPNPLWYIRFRRRPATSESHRSESLSGHGQLSSPAASGCQIESQAICPQHKGEFLVLTFPLAFPFSERNLYN